MEKVVQQKARLSIDVPTRSLAEMIPLIKPSRLGYVASSRSARRVVRHCTQRCIGFVGDQGDPSLVERGCVAGMPGKRQEGRLTKTIATTR